MEKTLLKLEKFNIRTEPNQSGIIHVEIKGLGVVSINRNGEGVIVDVFDMSKNNVSLDSLALEDSDFSEGFTHELQSEITKYDPTIELEPLDCSRAYSTSVRTHTFIEEYFNKNEFDVSSLKPLKGESKDFHEQVQDLTRPYIKITDEQYKQLMGGDNGFYLTQGGKVVTFGWADGGYALMPLQDSAGSEVLAKQSLLAEILHKKGVSDTHIETISNTGWHLWQSNGDYTDFELDVTYQDEEENNDDRYSLNVHLTFRWEDNYVYMVLGTNLGDVFNDYHQVELGAQTLEAAIDDYIEKLSNAAEQGAEEDEYLALTINHREAWSDIKAGAAKLSETLGITHQGDS